MHFADVKPLVKVTLSSYTARDGGNAMEEEPLELLFHAWEPTIFFNRLLESMIPVHFWRGSCEPANLSTLKKACACLTVKRQ